MSSAPKSSTDRLAGRILLGMVVGLFCGLIVRWLVGQGIVGAARAEWLATQVLDPFGKIFLRLLMMVVVPLVFTSLMLGVTQLGRLDHLGPMAARTFGIFGLNMAIGVALGLALMNVVRPGDQVGPELRQQLLSENSAQTVELQKRATEISKEGALSFARLVDMFLPANLLRDVVNLQILPLIVFALLLGASATLLPAERRLGLLNALEVAAQVLTQVVDWALRLAPYAVAALLAGVAIKFGVKFLQSLLLFALIVLGGLTLHLFGTMSVLLKLFSRVPPGRFFRAVGTVLVTAFSTSSSNATLPTSIRVCQERLGVSAPTAGFVLPLGATINMSGTALYEGCVVLFIAQVYGIPLGWGAQMTLLVLAVLSAVAVAGLPGASLPLIMGLLPTFGVPPEGIALILGLDRLLDMARTTMNVAADLVTAVIVDEHLGPDGASPPPGTVPAA